MIEALTFYLFATVLVFSGIMVISARNPVHSVLFLILAFFNSAGLFVLLGAEFVAMIMVIVYVGAVAVLFLFVVMMLDINFSELRRGALKYLPIGAMVGAIFLTEMVFVAGRWIAAPSAAFNIGAPTPDPEAVTNTHALGALMYTHYVYLFEAAGLILLVAMIGAIVLTLRIRPGVRKQKIAKQISRTREETMAIRKITPGTGV